MLRNEGFSCEKPTERSALFFPHCAHLTCKMVLFFTFISPLTIIKRLFEDPSLAMIFFFFFPPDVVLKPAVINRFLHGVHFLSSGIVCEINLPKLDLRE